MKNVLVVDDSQYMRNLVKEALTRGGYTVVGEASCGEQAIDLAYELKPDIITLDNVMPDMLGLEVLRSLNKGNLNANVVIVSAIGQESMKNKGIELGAIGYVVKPFTVESLLDQLSGIFDRRANAA